MTVSDELDELNRRLAAIQDELLSLPPGPSADRYALLLERDELRARAVRFRRESDEGRPKEELKAELESLKRLRKRSVEDRIGFVSAGDTNQATGGGAWVKLGAQARAGGDLGRVNARIARLEALLVQLRQVDED